ncbi:hypothetical protein [Streptomyces odontomachi]|uniref:hypothetical protein n=1 Tax=Streptomyces odontomachi TaxID=2944940 RepID=UPI00210D4909|nr:hypothetical protein [Streptomyces sp. ODS25]
MTTEGPDLQAGHESLAKITKGLTDALGELKELGTAGSAGTGRGFEILSLSQLAVGYGELADVFESFCERWEWGVRSLIGEANTFARGVGLAAGTFHETDEYVEGAAKIAVNAAIGDPHLSEDQVTDRSWGEVWGDNPFSQVQHADYSAESAERAQDAIRQGWNTAGETPGVERSFTAQDPADQPPPAHQPTEPLGPVQRSFHPRQDPGGDGTDAAGGAGAASDGGDR